MNNDIDNMSPSELQAHIAELYAKRAALLAQRATQPAQPEPAQQYTVTAKQRRRLAAFDNMTDGDQLNALRGMWGQS